MKKLMLTLGLFASMAAFALSDAEKQGMLNRNMGVTASQVGLGDLVMGGSGSVYVSKAGSTMSGKLRITDTGSSVTHNSNALASDGGVSALGDLFAGQVGAGTGGKVRLRNDSANGAGRVGIAGSTGATNFTIRSVLGGVDAIDISSAGQVSFGAQGIKFLLGSNRKLDSVVLGGVSTFISNTSITANSFPFPVGVGASNVAPWLIGVSTGTGYSLGAAGAGTAKVLIVVGGT